MFGLEWNLRSAWVFGGRGERGGLKMIRVRVGLKWIRVRLRVEMD